LQHNLLCQNCHSHVAHCLNLMRYDGRANYNMFLLGAWMFWSGKYTNREAVVRTWLPFVIACLLVILVACLS
jgi:hypothetical protein